MARVTQLVEHPVIEEILQPAELEHLIESKTPLRHYIGFEISGRPHIGSAMITMMVVKELLELDAHITIFLADWHAWINNKLGGDRKVIRQVAEGFFKEAMISAAKALNIDDSRINFVLGSELYEQNPQIWANVVETSKHTTLARILRSISIMGRQEKDIVNFASLIYPPLQVGDIYTMQVNVAHAGTDQRKAHVLARQVATKMTISPLLDSSGKKIKPVAIHHKLLPSLLTPPKWPMTPEEIKMAIGEMKMSKSKPEGAVFMTDTPEEIKKKVMDAFSPEGDLSYNPVVTWAEMLVFPLGHELHIKRPEKWGGDLTVTSAAQLQELFGAKQLHPQDLKQALADFLIELLAPSRAHFSSKERQEMLDFVSKITITR